MKFYIATALENHQAHNNLRDWLKLHGHDLTYDWSAHGPVFSHGLAVVRDVAAKEHNGVVTADAVIVLWPGGRGTHVEMGMAIASGIPVFLMSTVNEHHEATKETCAFYHHPGVTRSRSPEELCIQLRSYFPERNQ